MTPNKPVKCLKAYQIHLIKIFKNSNIKLHKEFHYRLNPNLIKLNLKIKVILSYKYLNHKAII